MRQSQRFHTVNVADVTDPEALRQIGIANIDVVIVTMANHLEASVMATML